MSGIMDKYSISLEYIHEFFQLNKTKKPINVRDNRVIEIRKILKRTKDEIERVLPIREKTLKKIITYIRLKDMDPHERTEREQEEYMKLDDCESKDYFKIKIYAALYEFLGIRAGDEFRINPYSIERNPFLPNISGFPDFVDEIPYLRIDPIKLIFNVWHRDLKKGQYGGNESIKNKLLEFKENTKGTEKEYLFQNVNEKTKVESLRKKSLNPRSSKKSDIRRFDKIDKLADFIYKKSFSEKTAQKNEVI